MFRKLIVSVVVMSAVAGVAQVPCSNVSLGPMAALNGFVPSPNDAWHQDISNAPVDPLSSTILTSTNDLGGSHLRANFSSVAGGDYGIPYTVVDSQATPSIALPITLYAAESDITLVPIPAVLPVEEATGKCPLSGNDRHALIIDRNQCVLYEIYQADHCTTNAWTGSDMAVWDLNSTEKRPYGYTSADAAGLSIFAGLIRYDEIVAGVINHAIRFTAKHTKTDPAHGLFAAPASHAAGNSSTTNNIMGMRLRLRANYDISGFSTTNQIILTALKKYGMILADNGSNLFLQGTPDARWNDSDLVALRNVLSSGLEVVQMGALYDSKTAPKGAPPTIVSFTASATTIPVGGSVTLTPTVTGASYSYIDNAGFVRGPVTVSPTATTTYTLTSRNEFGTASASVKVTVGGTQTVPSLAFAAIPGQTYGATPFTVSASSQSTGAVTYSVISGPATISGNAVNVTGVGTVVVKATQAAAGTYGVATATTSFTVAAASSGLAFAGIADMPYSTTPLAVTSTTASSGSIVYSVAGGPATVSGNKVTLTGIGTVSMQANQAAAGNYLAGVAVTTFHVAAADPQLTLGSIADHAQNSAPFALGATSLSAAPIVYSIASGNATVSGNVVTLTGTGAVSVQARQVAAGNYLSGLSTASFNVTTAQTTPTLVFAPIGTQTSGAAPFAVQAASASTGAVSYAVVSGPATLSGNVVSLTGTGTVLIQASQAAAGTYGPATATTNFLVQAQATAALTFVAIPDLPYSPLPLTVSAGSSSPGAITYTIIVGPATISGTQVTLTGLGKVMVQANQAASGAYKAAVTTTSFHVVAAVPDLTLAPIFDLQLGGAAPFTVSATSVSPGAISYAILSGKASLSGNTLTVKGLGPVVVRARQMAAGNYAQIMVTTTFNVVP